MVISKDTKFWQKAKGDRCKVVAGCLLLTKAGANFYMVPPMLASKLAPIFKWGLPCWSHADNNRDVICICFSCTDYKSAQAYRLPIHRFLITAYRLLNFCQSWRQFLIGASHAGVKAGANF